MVHYDRVALAIFLLLLAIYLFTASGHTYAADEETIIYVTAGILRHDDFAVPPGGDAPTLGMMRGTDGRFYSQTGLAPSLIAAPFFGLGEAVSKFARARYNGFWTRFGVVTLLNPLVTALTATLLYCIGRWLGYRRRVALLTTIAFGLATIAWWFTKTAFTEPLAALLVLISFAGLVRFQKANSFAWLAVSGFAIGIALMTRLQLTLVVPLLAVYLIATVWGKVQTRDGKGIARVVLVWGVPILAALLVIGWYDWVRFASPFESGYSPYARLLGMPRAEWLYGLLFSPGKSLFWYSPPLIIGVLGLGWFGKKFPRETFFIGAFVMSQLLFYSGYEFWHGDSGWGPRFLVPVIPFLMLPFAESLTHARLRWVGYFTIGIGILVQIPALLVNTDLVVLRAAEPKPWDTLWMNDWWSAPIVANWNLLWDRLRAASVTIPALPAPPNARFFWFNDPRILHRADVWWWYLPQTQIKGDAVFVVTGMLGIVSWVLFFWGARTMARQWGRISM